MRGLCECPKCFSSTPVPSESGFHPTPREQMHAPNIISIEVKFSCPSCDGRLGMDVRQAGEMGFCPLCFKEIQCPHVSFHAGPDTIPEPVVERIVSLRLSREEMDFLSELEPSPERTVDHAA